MPTIVARHCGGPARFYREPQRGRYGLLRQISVWTVVAAAGLARQADGDSRRGVSHCKPGFVRSGRSIGRRAARPRSAMPSPPWHSSPRPIGGLAGRTSSRGRRFRRISSTSAQLPTEPGHMTCVSIIQDALVRPADSMCLTDPGGGGSGSDTRATGVLWRTRPSPGPELAAA
jgi:hypothetical protein